MRQVYVAGEKALVRIGPGGPVAVTYTGTAADAATMKGKVSVGDLGEGTFSGRKQ